MGDILLLAGDIVPFALMENTKIFSVMFLIILSRPGGSREIMSTTIRIFQNDRELSTKMSGATFILLIT